MVKIYPIKIKVILFLSVFIFSPFIAQAATLSINPATGIFETGEHIAVKIVATSDNAPFNAVSGLVSFPTSIFSIESISKINSVLNFWVTEPVISNNAGTVKFEGLSLGGFTGSTGTIITINLRATKAGSGKVSFVSGQILANDGTGTDITGNLNGATFSVKETTSKIATPQPKTIPPPVVPLPTLIPETPQPLPTLKAPEIMLGTKYGAGAIIGSSDYPKTQALITFVAENGTKIFILGVADGDGSFNILIPNSLKHGSYTVTAEMIKEDKTNSDASNTIIVQVGSIISDITWEIWLIIALLIISILYLILRIYFHFKKNGNTDDSVKNELQKTENVIKGSFDILRDDVTDRAQGIVSSVERTNIEELKKDIDSTEKVITKEIKNIESK
jgi:hypothetical protein